MYKKDYYFVAVMIAIVLAVGTAVAAGGDVSALGASYLTVI